MTPVSVCDWHSTVKNSHEVSRRGSRAQRQDCISTSAGVKQLDVILTWKKFSSFQNQIETPEWCRDVWRNPGAAHHLPDSTVKQRGGNIILWGCFSGWVWEEGELNGPNENLIQWSTLRQNNDLLQTAKTPEECYTFVSVDWYNQTTQSNMTGETRKWLPGNCPHPAWQDLYGRIYQNSDLHQTQDKTKPVNYNISCSCILWGNCTQRHSFAY